jgi:hypothetical protein
MGSLRLNSVPNSKQSHQVQQVRWPNPDYDVLKVGVDGDSW